MENFKSILVKTIKESLQRFPRSQTSPEGLANHILAKDGMSEDLIDLIDVTDLTTFDGVTIFEARAVRGAILNRFSKPSGSGGSPHQGNGGDRQQTNQASPENGSGEGQNTGEPSVNANHDQNAPNPTTTPPLIPPFKLNMERIYFLKDKKFFDKGGKPDNALSKLIVKECVLQVNKKVPDADRKVMANVFDQLAEIHPSSFMIQLPNGKKLPGLLKKRLVDGIDNDHRSGRNNLQRNPTQEQYEKPRAKYTYGCVRWRVQNLPEGETEESILKIKQDMKDTYQDTRPSRWKKDEIENSMTLTFRNQRELINQNHEEAAKEQKKQRYGKRKKQGPEEEQNVDEPPALVTITTVKEEWPFLFTHFGMKTHFQLLTQVNPDNLVTFITKSGEETLSYFKSVRDKTQDVVYKNTFKRYKRACRAAGEDEQKLTEIKLKAIIILVAQHVGEDFKDLILLDEEFCVDTPNEDNLSVYPGLIAEGKTLFEAEKYHLSVDMHIVSSTKSFVEAMGMVFMTYYVLNLDYHPKTPATLEYLQRFAYSISPDQGHKRPRDVYDEKGNKKAGPTNIIHPKVSKLHCLIKDFSQVSSSESEKSDQQ